MLRTVAPSPGAHDESTEPRLWSSVRENRAGECFCSPQTALLSPRRVQELHHKSRYWHESCFRCAKCYKALAAEPFSARDDGKIMCGKCGAREDGNRCQGCYKVVMPGELTDSIFFLFTTLMSSITANPREAHWQRGY